MAGTLGPPPPSRLKMRWLLWALAMVVFLTVVYLLIGSVSIVVPNSKNPAALRITDLSKPLLPAAVPQRRETKLGEGPPPSKEQSLQPHDEDTAREKDEKAPSFARLPSAPSFYAPFKPFTLPPGMKNPSEAYVFVLTNDKPMHLIWALEGSLRNVSTTRRRIALVTDGVSAEARSVLEKLEMQVRPIPNLSHPRFKVTETRWKDTLSKLAILDQTDLSKFFYLDADILINYNMDDLFDSTTEGKITAMRDNSGCFNDVPKLNAGLLIASPNPTLKSNLLKALEDPENPTKDGMGDQALLNYYLNKHNMVSYRPEIDMAFLWRCSCVLEGKTPSYDWKKTRAIHFTGWYMDVPALVRDGINSRSWDPKCAFPWYQRWVDVHAQLKRWWEARHGPMPKFPVLKM